MNYRIIGFFNQFNLMKDVKVGSLYRQFREQPFHRHSYNQREDKPVKFTASPEANLNYKATKHFYGGRDKDRPKSHNMVLAVTSTIGIYYLIFIRDDIDDNIGIIELSSKPLYETQPKLAIPILNNMIAQQRSQGGRTAELERKLEFYMKDPKKHGG